MSVNNAEIYEPPALMDDVSFESQCEETLKINYFGVKKVRVNISFSPHK